MAAAGAALCLHAAQPLPALEAEARSVTVSGLSAGGYMAVQVHVALSAQVRGAGVLAGGPYYCAQGSLRTAYANCMRPGAFAPLPRTQELRAEAQARARGGAIDPLANLAGSRAWLFHGREDATVSREVVQRLAEFYRSLEVQVTEVGELAAGHAMPTLGAGNRNCGATRPPFINACGYDAAGELLAHLYGPLQAPRPKPAGRLLRFDQAPFGDRAIGLDSEGFVFVPPECERERCRVHVAFHGCRQGAGEIGERFVREAGYNRWAQANRLIVLYPQVRASWRPFNPRGCWDWWGYTGAAYHTREGAQIRAVQGMLERLSGPRR
ncbi:MAG TPA: PHB depolymerase family esterase [Burkholderiales bacterium]|nr:PHB depolymerase family esterase [Burkholderiales bacterium]